MEAGFAAQVLDDKGNAATVRGINIGTGKLLGCNETTYIYPVQPWVADLLRERTSLKEQLSTINRALDRIGVSARRSYGRIAPDSYEGEVKKLSDEIAASAALAENSRPK